MTNAHQSPDSYAVRKVTELRGIAHALFAKPETQATLEDARSNYLAEAMELNQAPLRDAEAQRERQVAAAQ